MTMSRIATKKLFADESRICNKEEPAANAPSSMNLKIRSILIRYIWYGIHFENMSKIIQKSSSDGNNWRKTTFLDNLVDTIIRIKGHKIIFIAYEHGAGQFYF